MSYRRRICGTALLCLLSASGGCRKKEEPPVELVPSGIEVRVRALSAERVLVKIPGQVEIRSLPGGRVLFRGTLRGTVAARCAGAAIELGGRVFTAAVRIDSLPVAAAGDESRVSADPPPAEQLVSDSEPALFHRRGADFTVAVILDGSQARSCRGARELRAEDGLVRAVNALDLQYYLLGVIGAEMPSYFDGEALAAQAVASRTFALYALERAREAGRSRVFAATTGFQVYKGVEAETRSVHRAVVRTRGQALSWRGGFFSSYYHSTCGGHTADSNEALGVASIAPLAGVACGGCSGGRFASWSSVLEAGQLELVAREYLEKNRPELQLGEASALEVAERSADGRILYLRLRHSLGAFEWRADSFRLAVEARFPGIVRSTAFTPERAESGGWVLRGSGFGHGVGLCQVGAGGLAREGLDYRRILRHYYPGSELMEAY